jgi:hypothetical protein
MAATHEKLSGPVAVAVIAALSFIAWGVLIIIAIAIISVL